MQKTIYVSEIRDYSDYIDPSVIDYIADGQIETFESFDEYDLIAFDWYDLRDPEGEPAQILIYLDRDDLFCICENETAFRAASALFVPGGTNEQALYLFFRNLLKGSSKFLEQLEDEVAELDDDVVDGIEDDLGERLIDKRNQILQAKKYYEQFEFLFDEICDNDNRLIGPEHMRYFEALRNRSVRLVAQVLDLREYMNYVRESYQTQIGIEQNDLMKVFTMVTSIFLPLTLIVGWYGMNVKMPEFDWTYGYLFVVGLCLVIGLIWFLIFKKKKWIR